MNSIRLVHISELKIGEVYIDLFHKVFIKITKDKDIGYWCKSVDKAPWFAIYAETLEELYDKSKAKYDYYRVIYE